MDEWINDFIYKVSISLSLTLSQCVSCVICKNYTNSNKLYLYLISCITIHLCHQSPLQKRRPTNLLGSMSGGGGWKTRYFQLDNSGVLEWSDCDTGEFIGAVDIQNAQVDGKALYAGGDDASLQSFTLTPVKGASFFFFFSFFFHTNDCLFAWFIFVLFFAFSWRFYIYGMCSKKKK
jgi:hypothetical protein